MNGVQSVVRREFPNSTDSSSVEFRFDDPSGLGGWAPRPVGELVTSDQRRVFSRLSKGPRDEDLRGGRGRPRVPSARADELINLLESSRLYVSPGSGYKRLNRATSSFTPVSSPPPSLSTSIPRIIGTLTRISRKTQPLRRRSAGTS